MNGKPNRHVSCVCILVSCIFPSHLKCSIWICVCGKQKRLATLKAMQINARVISMLNIHVSLHLLSSCFHSQISTTFIVSKNMQMETFSLWIIRTKQKLLRCFTYPFFLSFLRWFNVSHWTTHTRWSHEDILKRVTIVILNLVANILDQDFL